MNTLRNKVQLIGHLGQTPEIITFENGNKLAKISLATDSVYKNVSGEKVKEVQWHSLIAWGNQAQIIEDYCIKGQEIAIEGKLINRTYETKAGERRSKTEVQVSEIMLLDKKAKEVEK